MALSYFTSPFFINVVACCIITLAHGINCTFCVGQIGVFHNNINVTFMNTYAIFNNMDIIFMNINTTNM